MKKLRVAPKVVFPYRLALKAYAYANKEFSYAMDQLSYMQLSVPLADNPRHYPILMACKAEFDHHKRNARKVSRDYDFDKSQTRAMGIDPFYDWIIEENDPTSADARLMNQVVDGMTDVNLRRIVSVSLFINTPPHKISHDLRSRGSRTSWTTEHIEIYYKFFWNMEDFDHGALNDYMYVSSHTRVGVDGSLEPDLHYSYIEKMFKHHDKNELLNACDLPFEDAYEVSEQDIGNRLRYIADKAMRTGDPKAVSLIRAMIAFEEYKNNKGDSSDDLRDVFASLNIMATPHQVRQAGVDMKDLGYREPMDMIEGEVSDPRLTGRSKFLDIDGF